MKEMKAPWKYLEEKGSEKQKEEVQTLWGRNVFAIFQEQQRPTGLEDNEQAQSRWKWSRKEQGAG